MQFSDTANKQGLIEDVDFWCDSDSTSYPTADKTRSINHWYHTVATWIWRASGTWEFDDSNKTDLPIAIATLVDGQQDYSIPTDALKILAIEVKDSGGNWARLQPLDKSQLGSTITDFQNNDGLPNSYDVLGRTLLLYPAPASGSVTVSGGLKLHLARTVDNFTAADTTKVPGFAEDYHRVLSMGGAYDFLIKRDMDKADRLMAEITKMRSDLTGFYGERHRDMPVKVRPRRERYN